MWKEKEEEDGKEEGKRGEDGVGEQVRVCVFEMDWLSLDSGSVIYIWVP